MASHHNLLANRSRLITIIYIICNVVYAVYQTLRYALSIFRYESAHACVRSLSPLLPLIAVATAVAVAVAAAVAVAHVVTLYRDIIAGVTMYPPLAPQ